MAQYILEHLEDDIIKCMKCGNCQAFCPIYKETKMEGDVARGKIQLAAAVLAGEIGYSPSVEKRLLNCLTCKACSANCPCGVDCTKIIVAARQALGAKKGLPKIKRAIFEVVKRPMIFDLSMRSAAIFSPLMFNKKGKLRVPVVLNPKKVYPLLSTSPVKNRLPEFNPASAEAKQRAKKPTKVALFTGCSMNYIYPNVGKSIVEILNANGVDVVIPKDQSCCGAPIYIHGDRKAAIGMAKGNIAAMNKHDDIEAIITGCGTCGSQWQKYFPEMMEDQPEAEKSKEYSKKVYDIAYFLTDILQIDTSLLGEVNRTVTYHDPCHLKRGMNVYKEPRQLLKSIPGLKFVEMKNADRCCGGAGSFSLTHFDLSMDIHKHKTEALKASGADTVVTGCGSCMMQFADGHDQAKIEVPIMHTMEVLAESYRNKKS
ncbi:hypothetical protein BHU72_09750 [Desulfuribacillus stibiiarsenatis]|uniref:Glycolate oxidase iron-sulfur subunit n=1 Tax=Desulfuribacillus stibiiarsenatis TaxID=1390249 RepID=A0A1E5L2W3_9FIRM|nr:(Fe-S)-binding protein [Desulfuribacillus stibiiarsenatis]OEH84480.1 hypothetical protein BHU72_09750 [Desulfuribacillus stibiiarsenatis]